MTRTALRLSGRAAATSAKLRPLAELPAPEEASLELLDDEDGSEEATAWLT